MKRASWLNYMKSLSLLRLWFRGFVICKYDFVVIASQCKPHNNARLRRVKRRITRLVNPDYNQYQHAPEVLYKLSDIKLLLYRYMKQYSIPSTDCEIQCLRSAQAEGPVVPSTTDIREWLVVWLMVATSDTKQGKPEDWRNVYLAYIHRFSIGRLGCTKQILH